MPCGRRKRARAGKTSTDAWAPTAQCRAATTVQKKFKPIQLILNEFKSFKLQLTQKGLFQTQKI
jgi:hypothetical protein